MIENFPILNNVLNQIHNLLEEEKVGKKTYTVSPKRILETAEVGRLKRSKDVKLLVVEKRGVGKNYKRYDFEAESGEKIEAESHIGYVELMERSGNVRSLFCSCSDFQATHLTWNVDKHKIADYKKGQEIGAMNEYFDPHNEAKPVVMNPTGAEDPKAKGMCCKHLLGVLSKIEDGKIQADS